MASSDKEKIKELFGSALDLTSTQRAEFLARVCGMDQDLRAKVESLLEEHARARGFLEHPTQPETRPTPAEDCGTRIAHYKLLERIGEGGFGSVYMAEQEQPIRRRVALKVLKPGMDSRQVIARFEAERQALALMDHPNIARVFEAGTTDSGRPYFVMELVHGVAVTRYCDEAGLTTSERLQVFVPICRAVQHAHQKGIIHRDLKPSNVLVTLHDGQPVPKVIDFGIAKAIEQRLTDKTVFTGFGQVIGTPAYMSPEQAELSGNDVDTRSDVYSLGVLLYEMLAGVPPFDAARLQGAGVAEILRIIREEEPPRPSARVSTLGNALASVAARRRTEPRRLGALLRGDLDWVVMKALAKERHRRYDSASHFAADIERYLAREPVSAGPPGLAYRVSRFVRRNRVAVAATLAVAVALVAGLAGTTSGLLRARAAQRAATESATDAQQKLAIAREGADLLLDGVVRELPKIPGTRELAKRLLALALKHYEKLAAETPDGAADERRIWVGFQELGDAYQALSEGDLARQAHERFALLVERAVAKDPSNRLFRTDLAVSLDRAGARAFSAGSAAEAWSSFERERELLEELASGDAHDERVQELLASCHGWLSSLHSLNGDEAASVASLERGRSILEPLVAQDPSSPARLAALSRILQSLARSSADTDALLTRAAELEREIAALEGETPANLSARASIAYQRGHVAFLKGDHLEAWPPGQDARGLLERLTAAEPRNPLYQLRLLEVLQLLSDSAFETGRLDESRALAEEAHAVATRLAAVEGKSIELLLGLARGLVGLADLAERTGDLSDARAALERGAGIWNELLELAPRNAAYLEGAVRTDQRLGRVANQTGDFRLAREHLSRADEHGRRLREGDPGVRSSFLCIPTSIALTDIALWAGDTDAAEASARAALELAESLVEDAGNPDYVEALAVALDRRGDVALRRNDLAAAMEYRRRCQELHEQLLLAEPESVIRLYGRVDGLAKVADLAFLMSRFQEAELLFEDVVESGRELVDREPSNYRHHMLLAFGLVRAGELLQRAGKLAEADERYSEMFEVMSGIAELQPDTDRVLVSLADACEKLAILRWQQGDQEGAREWTELALARRRDLADAPDSSPQLLNAYAWTLLTCEPSDLRDPPAALVYARRAVERTAESDAGALDTLALCYFETGDAVHAVETQERALTALGTQDATRRVAFESRLARYLSMLDPIER